MIVTPVPIDPPTEPPPDPTDRPTWTVRRLEHVRWELEDLAPGTLAHAEASEANALDAEESAEEAADSQAAAAISEANAANAANFKGAWSSLTGALNKPASVLHNSAYWALLNNLADVTTSQPGVSADWSELGVTSVNGMRGVVVIEDSVADSLYLNQLYGAF